MRIRQAISSGLMTRMLQRLGHIQTIELMCDPDLVPFYERFGMKPSSGMVLRRAGVSSRDGRSDR